MYVFHALDFVVIFAFFFVYRYLVTIGTPGFAPAIKSKDTAAERKNTYGTAYR